jgi:hypothetical protein
VPPGASSCAISSTALEHRTGRQIQEVSVLAEESRRLHLCTAADCCSCQVKFVVKGGELTRESTTSRRRYFRMFLCDFSLAPGL